MAQELQAEVAVGLAGKRPLARKGIVICTWKRLCCARQNWVVPRE